MPMWATGRSDRQPGMTGCRTQRGTRGQACPECPPVPATPAAARRGNPAGHLPARPPAPRRPVAGLRGFTLLETLVALVILALLGSSLALSLPDAGLAAERQALAAWERAGDETAQRANMEANPQAWELQPRLARSLREQDGLWLPVGPALPLPEGLTLVQLSIEGQARPAGSRILFGEVPPVFTLVFQGRRQWLLQGEASGEIHLREQP